MNNYCVYIHKNKTSNKIYVGLSGNVKTRWAGRGVQYKPHNDNPSEFYNDILKYGWDGFEHIILEKGLSKEQAELKEQYYIFMWQTQDKEKGYNVHFGGGGGFGGKVYDEHPRGMLGKHHSEESKERMREANTGEKNGFYQANWDDYGGHPRGMLGKSQTLNQRMKASNGVVKVTMPNGEINYYLNLNEARQKLGMGYTLIKTILDSGVEYKSHYKKYKKFNGLKVEKVQDDTELTQFLKEYE